MVPCCRTIEGEVILDLLETWKPVGVASTAKAVKAFLEDEEQIRAIKEHAREEAEERAAGWDL